MPGSKRNQFGRCILWLGLTTALGGAALFALQDRAVRASAEGGLAVAVLASTSAIVLLAFALDRSFKHLLGAVVVGFLLRMLLVTGGLLLARSWHGDVLAFALAFFVLYLAHQVIELRMVVRRARPAAAEART